MKIGMDETTEQALRDLYEDLMAPSIDELTAAAKAANLKVTKTVRNKTSERLITRSDVQIWLKGNEHWVEHAPRGKDRKENQFRITDEPNSFVVDAIFKGDFNVSQNKGYRGFLLFVEITTRKAYAYPFKTGSVNSPPEERESLEIFERFLKDRETEGHPVKNISGDNGKEFDNKSVRNLLLGKFITPYFHRPNDHRANGILNSIVRRIRRRIGNDAIEWVSRLQPAITLWNKHTSRYLPDAPNTLEADKTKRQNVREDALSHNRKVWKRTSYADHPIVQHFLQKGYFGKEGKQFMGDFEVGDRQGYSYQLRKPDGSILANAYRPYELRETLGKKFYNEQTAYRQQQEDQDANKAAARAARRARRELGAAQAPPVERLQRARAPVAARFNPAGQVVKAASKPVKLDESSIPIKILAHKINGRQLLFHIQWKDTPAFRIKWSSDPSVDMSTQTSWRPAGVLTERGRTNQVVGLHKDAEE